MKTIKNKMLVLWGKTSLFFQPYSCLANSTLNALLRYDIAMQIGLVLLTLGSFYRRPASDKQTNKTKKKPKEKKRKKYFVTATLFIRQKSHHLLVSVPRTNTPTLSHIHSRSHTNTHTKTKTSLTIIYHSDTFLRSVVVVRFIGRVKLKV